MTAKSIKLCSALLARGHNDSACPECAELRAEAQRASDREALREVDLAYLLGDTTPSLDQLELLRSVWERAYQHGIWKGIDITAARVQKALGQATWDAGTP